MSRKPRHCATPSKDSTAAPLENPGDSPITVVFDGPDGPYVTFTAYSSLGPDDATPTLVAEARAIVARIQECRRESQERFEADRLERSMDWAEPIRLAWMRQDAETPGRPKHLTLGQLKQIWI